MDNIKNSLHRVTFVKLFIFVLPKEIYQIL